MASIWLKLSSAVLGGSSQLDPVVIYIYSNYGDPNSPQCLGVYNPFQMAIHGLYIRSTPHPVTVTTRIITYLVGNPYKPSFATVTGWGVDPTYI